MVWLWPYYFTGWCTEQNIRQSFCVCVVELSAVVWVNRFHAGISCLSHIHGRREKLSPGIWHNTVLWHLSGRTSCVAKHVCEVGKISCNESIFWLVEVKKCCSSNELRPLWINVSDSVFFLKLTLKKFPQTLPTKHSHTHVFAGIASILYVFSSRVPTCNITLISLTAVQFPLKPPWLIALDEKSIASFRGSIFIPDCTPTRTYMLGLTQEMFSSMCFSL